MTMSPSWVCPTITAASQHDFALQLARLTPFAKRIHIDLADGTLTANTLVDINDIKMPHIEIVDIHLMSNSPQNYLDLLIELKPHLVVIHAEADVNLVLFAAVLHRAGIKAGLAVLQGTEISTLEAILPSYDHLLIFSGNLGHFGGHVDLELLHKAADEKSREARTHQPHIEIAWDGGINDQNAHELIKGGVDVLNVGGYIQKAENPMKNYQILEDIAQGHV